MPLFDMFNGKKELREETPEQQAESATRKVSGFSSLEDVKAAASSGTTPIAEPIKRGVRGRGAVPTHTISSADAEKLVAAQKKEQEKQEAIDLAFGTMAKQLAETPYQIWAFYAEQPEFALKPEESQKLAMAYHKLAKALSPDMTGPIAMLSMVVLLNVSFVGQRIAEDRKRKSDEKKKEEEEKQNANSRPN